MKLKSDETTIIVECFMCKQDNIVEVKTEDFQKWKDGWHVQDAFPYLSADQRELLISRTCPKCWTKLFGSGE